MKNLNKHVTDTPFELNQEIGYSLDMKKSLIIQGSTQEEEIKVDNHPKHASCIDDKCYIF
jgi:hypothetical protein